MIKDIGVAVGLALVSALFAGCRDKQGTGDGEKAVSEKEPKPAELPEGQYKIIEEIKELDSRVDRGDTPGRATTTRPGTPGAEKQVLSKRSRAEKQMQLIITGLKRYKLDYGEFPVPFDNSGEGANGAKALYQALSGDGDTQLFFGGMVGGPGRGGGNPSTGIVGSTTGEALVEGIDPKANKHGFVNSDYELVDPFGRPWRYRKHLKDDPAGPTNNKTFDLWSVGEEGKEDNEAEWIKNW